MALKEMRAVRAETGFEGRDRFIRRFAKLGSRLILSREPDNPHDRNAISVLLECRLFLGLIKGWQKIGYIQSSRAEKLVPKIDSGEMKVVDASIVYLYCPPDKTFPAVTALINYETPDRVKQSSKLPQTVE